MPGASRRPRVPLVGYDEVVSRLDNLFDVLSAVNDTLLAAPHFKRKARQPNRAIRPETAQQRLKRQQSVNKLDAIVQHMTGGR